MRARVLNLLMQYLQFAHALQSLYCLTVLNDTSPPRPADYGLTDKHKKTAQKLSGFLTICNKHQLVWNQQMLIKMLTNSDLPSSIDQPQE